MDDLPSPEEFEVAQEPRGCRYVFGDPGHGPWCYCQEPLKEGHSLGNLANPPYCEEHLALIHAPYKPFYYYAGWASMNRVECDPDRHDHAPMPVDLYVKIRMPSKIAKGFSHD